MRSRSEQIHSLVAVKLMHTAIWCFFAGCILAIPYAAASRQYSLAVALSGFVLAECFVLAFTRGRCPFTDWAARYTDERADNFDIYLPLWLARHNKVIFGMLFVFGELFLLGQWLFSRR